MAEHPKSKAMGGFYQADGSPCVIPFTKLIKYRNLIHAELDSRVECLEVLEVLPEGLEEEPELPELEEVGPVLVVAGGLVLGEVEGAVDRRLAVEQLVAPQHVAHALVSLM